MIWSNNKVKLEMLKGLRTSSKMSLKMSCLAIANGDLKKATNIRMMLQEHSTLYNP